MKSKATIKIILDPTDKSEKRLLKLRVTFNRKPHLYSLNTEKRLSVAEFSNSKLKAYKDALSEAKKAFDIANTIVDDLGSDFSFELFLKKYREGVYGERKEDKSFASISEGYVQRLDVYSTKQNYKASANWVERVHSGVKIEAIDEEFVDSMVAKMKEDGLSENSIRIYCRQLKAIFQQALDDGLVEGHNPFAKYAKRSIGRSHAGLSEEELAAFLQYKARTEKEEFGQDFFILSIACSGANIGDILSLKNANIEGENISFIRRKTRKNPIPIVIPLVSRAEDIFNKYGKIDIKHPDYFILPFLTGYVGDIAIRNRIHDIIKKINKGLDGLSEGAGLRKITTYDARHTYATVVRDRGLSKEQIQKLLGHASSNTTEAYLKGLSAAILDKNKDIISEMLDTQEVGKSSLEEDFNNLMDKYGVDEVVKILEAKKQGS